MLGFRKIITRLAFFTSSLLRFYLPTYLPTDRPTYLPTCLLPFYFLSSEPPSPRGRLTSPPIPLLPPSLPKSSDPPGRACRPPRLPTYLPYLLTFLLPFFLSSFLPLFRTSQGGGLPPPLPPSWHKPGMLSGTRTSSEASFFDEKNSHHVLMSFCRLFDHPKLQKLIQKRSKMASKTDPKTKRKLAWGFIRKS